MAPASSIPEARIGGALKRLEKAGTIMDIRPGEPFVLP